jgi:hypothetical protein
MPMYMKAYRLGDVQRYRGFSPSSAASRSLAADSIVYVREDLAVVTGCFGGDPVLFESAAPEWTRFCRDELDFQVPDWEAESLRLRESSPAGR